MAQPTVILPRHRRTMLGAGVSHNGREYITHSTLPHHLSAHITLVLWQKIFLLLLLLLLLTGLFFYPWATAIGFIAVLTAVYFADAVFNFILIFKSLHFPPEITFSDIEHRTLNIGHLPTYSILCPLYREARVLPQFVEAISALDWPKAKLDVLLLLEEDDTTTIEVAHSLNLPSYFRTIIVPVSQPKTKPKACNYGLSYVKGEYVVVYDAEDRPEPDQLKKAYLAFQKVPASVTCLQSKLNYYNPRHNLLTRLFTAEYSLWFDVVLPGLQSINTTLPLGGTSNHFRTKILKKLHGWDAFNVTEDCDLGSRLFKAGYTTAIIDSTTYEEANSQLGNWIRQRSRWIKGYLQTFLVHNRHPLKFLRDHGWHALIFQLIVGGKIAFMLINPFLWLMTFAYFTLYSFVGPAIESLYPAPVFYMAAFSAVFGNFLYLYYYMIGCAKRGHWDLIKYVFFIPLYWLFISIAGFKALAQLILRPHYWEKTHHGFHLDRAESSFLRSQIISRFGWVRPLAGHRLTGATLLVASAAAANFFNFLYNAYLGRVLSASDFGLVALMGSLIFIVNLPIGALSGTVSYRASYLIGKFGSTAQAFWSLIRRRSIMVAILCVLVWLVLSPWLAGFFRSPDILPFWLFAPIWTIAFTAAVDRGFLTANLRFFTLAVVILGEALSKFGLAVLFVHLGYPQLVYAAIPLSMVLPLGIGWWVARRTTSPVVLDPSHITYFPRRYFATSILMGLSALGFLSLDVILAKRFLDPVSAGNYALLSLVGKMIYFFGKLVSQFTIPLVSRAEGEGADSQKVFLPIFLLSVFATTAGFVALGPLGHLTVPLLLGAKTIPILPYLTLYSLALALYTMTTTVIDYHQARRHYLFPVTGFFLAIAQVVALSFFHDHLSMLVNVIFALSLFYFLLITGLHFTYDAIIIIFHNLHDLLDLFFLRLNGRRPLPSDKLRILAFNWRDTKHVWAGGAEVYLHEVAKRWVTAGHTVTLFCGNDGHDPRNEMMDGVKIIRRGGLFTVYIWAFLYYVLKFRGRFDVIIDSENGIPFFTPLFTRLPVFLLIHHVHQDLFRSNLYFPMDKIAMLLEGKLMPLVYRNSRIITVSDSSRKDILSLGFFKSDNITVVNPGIDPSIFYTSPKTRYPSFVYLGRIRAQKNIDVAIRAFASVVKKYPKARFSIAGWGDKLDELAKLAKSLRLAKSVKFLGKVSDAERVKLLGKSWAMLQPSSFEGWGITVIEANACGTPVIASNVPGLRDSVLHDESGILVSLKNEFELAECMKLLISLPDYRSRLSQNALAWSTNFNWDVKSAEFIRAVSNRNQKQELTIPLAKPGLAYSYESTDQHS
ncbi:MAG: family 2 glycosyl transferase [Microgenomates group bacterium Gr01-1014_16]|nr:MAG: family 2 glycosyl transferase [Microgenomates group bacterium Gr01-1014_16]